MLIKEKTCRSVSGSLSGLNLQIHISWFGTVGGNHCENEMIVWEQLFVKNWLKWVNYEGNVLNTFQGKPACSNLEAAAENI